MAGNVMHTDIFGFVGSYAALESILMLTFREMLLVSSLVK